MNHTDAVVEGVFGGADDGGLAVDENFTLIGEVNAREHIHHGGFAAAVFAQQSQYLALVNIQIYLVIGHHGAKGFGDAAHLDCGGFVIQENHSFDYS